MRYSPYESEYAAVPTMSNGELLDYFLFRIFETEEVWGLSGKNGWLTYSVDGQTIMPLWPYHRYAQEAAASRWSDNEPASVSLEYFLYEMMADLVSDTVMVEVLPRQDEKLGCLISPRRLLDILEGMVDAGTYSLEG